MGTLLTHWGKLIPSEVILQVARESHDATHEVGSTDLGAWSLCRQPMPADSAVQADPSRQEPVLISCIYSKAITTGKDLEL